MNTVTNVRLIKYIIDGLELGGKFIVELYFDGSRHVSKIIQNIKNLEDLINIIEQKNLKIIDSNILFMRGDLITDEERFRKYPRIFKI